MEMQGSRALAITQQQAWEALNNPDVLKACIAGCDKFERTADNQYTVGVAVKIGPVAARFTGRITLTDVNPPESYTLNFDGQGGAAGFGNGEAKVKLRPQGTGCELGYSVRAQVGGKIAQLGQRLIDGVARNMAEDFFKRFDQEMQRRHPEAYAVAAAQAPQPPAEEVAVPARTASVLWIWVAAAAVLLAALVWWMRG